MKLQITILVISILLFSCKEKTKENNLTYKIVDSIISCKCFDGISSSKNDNPKLTFSFENGKSISICGFLEKEMTKQDFIISEFNVFDCVTGKSYAEYDATQICRIIKKQNGLQIQELKLLPVGKDWSWKLIQIGEQSITTNETQLQVSELNPKVQSYTIDKNLQVEFLNSIKDFKTLDSDWELIIAKLESISIIGNENAWDILKNLEEFTQLEFDGASAETWKESVANVEWIRK